MNGDFSKGVTPNLTPTQERLWKTLFPLAAERAAKAASANTRFAYYTRAETATSILKTKRIWMRKSMCMNDYMEVQHGLQCLSNTLYKTDAGKRFAAVLDQVFKGLWSEIEKLLNDRIWHLRTDTYFTCVSERKVEEDILGRLSMWRAYGGTNGVALVMNNAPFQAHAPSDVLKTSASPVVYFDPEKFEEKFGEVVNNIENDADFIREQPREERATGRQGLCNPVALQSLPFNRSPGKQRLCDTQLLRPCVVNAFKRRNSSNSKSLAWHRQRTCSKNDQGGIL
jgi:hypothetical protein